ncbi:sugar ABC transporter ATP-binding protein [Paenibacillus sp.]|uniref:sugar ABC transporter ATP-binding protein n=1 Tax=Paenibacillus sp. TaxID=58172 RepID=UPI002D66617B|nr:sugar ABC transporter ATP-binding protein [Paenibacillus sp.]HZG87190.1 sugar ABC transporter ATP-binding protein [Paenibacillus sp.]
MKSDLLLRTNRISKSFPGVKALEDLNLEVARGEVHAVVGENGAGKSTLMNILSGVYSPDEGSIVFDGKETSLRSPRQAQELGIAMIHQELSLATNVSVMENVFIGRLRRNALGFIRYREMHSACRELLDSIGIDDIEPDQMVEELSVSKMQMVEIAKALSMNAKLLIMDEPTASLTKKETDLLLKLIGELKRRGVSVLYISHRMEEIFAISDTITVLRDGKQIATLPAASTSPNELVSLMVGRAFDKTFQRTYASVRPGAEPVLRTEGLTHGSKVVGCDLKVYPGEIVALTGLVGAGRSELAQTIFGVHRKDAGRIWLNGREADIRSARDALRHGIALLPEGRKIQGIFADMSVRENMTIAALRSFLSGGFVDGGREREAAESYVESLGIRTTGLEKEIKLLSGGNQQKAIFARCLLTKPKLLLLDEPTHGVDVGAKAEIYAIIDRLAQEGVAIVLISSELPEVLTLADRILVMREGRIVAELAHGEATQERIMSFATGDAAGAERNAG